MILIAFFTQCFQNISADVDLGAASVLVKKENKRDNQVMQAMSSKTKSFVFARYFFCPGLKNHYCGI
jgi:hypothetical protein